MYSLYILKEGLKYDWQFSCLDRARALRGAVRLADSAVVARTPWNRQMGRLDPGRAADSHPAPVDACDCEGVFFFLSANRESAPGAQGGGDPGPNRARQAYYLNVLRRVPWAK